MKRTFFFIIIFLTNIFAFAQNKEFDLIKTDTIDIHIAPTNATQNIIINVQPNVDIVFFNIIRDKPTSFYYSLFSTKPYNYANKTTVLLDTPFILEIKPIKEIDLSKEINKDFTKSSVIVKTFPLEDLQDLLKSKEDTTLEFYIKQGNLLKLLAKITLKKGIKIYDRNDTIFIEYKKLKHYIDLLTFTEAYRKKEPDTILKFKNNFFVQNYDLNNEQTKLSLIFKPEFKDFIDDTTKWQYKIIKKIISGDTTFVFKDTLEIQLKSGQKIVYPVSYKAKGFYKKDARLLYFLIVSIALLALILIIGIPLFFYLSKKKKGIDKIEKLKSEFNAALEVLNYREAKKIAGKLSSLAEYKEASKTLSKLIREKNENNNIVSYSKQREILIDKPIIFENAIKTLDTRISEIKKDFEEKLQSFKAELKNNNFKSAVGNLEELEKFCKEQDNYFDFCNKIKEDLKATIDLAKQIKEAEDLEKKYNLITEIEKKESFTEELFAKQKQEYEQIKLKIKLENEIYNLEDLEKIKNEAKKQNLWDETLDCVYYYTKVNLLKENNQNYETELKYLEQHCKDRYKEKIIKLKEKALLEKIKLAEEKSIIQAIVNLINISPRTETLQEKLNTLLTELSKKQLNYEDLCLLYDNYEKIYPEAKKLEINLKQKFINSAKSIADALNKQQKIDEAIDVYKKLQKIYPERRLTIGDKIRFLETKRKYPELCYSQDKENALFERFSEEFNKKDIFYSNFYKIAENLIKQGEDIFSNCKFIVNFQIYLLKLDTYLNRFKENIPYDGLSLKKYFNNYYGDNFFKNTIEKIKKGSFYKPEDVLEDIEKNKEFLIKEYLNYFIENIATVFINFELYLKTPEKYNFKIKRTISEYKSLSIIVEKANKDLRELLKVDFSAKTVEPKIFEEQFSLDIHYREGISLAKDYDLDFESYIPKTEPGIIFDLISIGVEYNKPFGKYSFKPKVIYKV